MKFKVDENLPGEIVADLRAAGHDADTVFDEGLAGASDAAVMARVQAESRAILTMDKGIADIRTYPPALYSGLILLRPRTTAGWPLWHSSASTCPRCWPRRSPGTCTS